MKLFEIPIYALTKEELSKRVNLYATKLKDKESGHCTEETLNRVIDSTTLPRLWDYNHIIGYIVISKEADDIILDEYLPVKTVEKYRWNTKNKQFVQNAGLVGMHFYIGNMKTDKEIRDRIHEILDELIKKLPQRYYVDREAFDAIDVLLDYSKFLK